MVVGEYCVYGHATKKVTVFFRAVIGGVTIDVDFWKDA